MLRQWWCSVSIASAIVCTFPIGAGADSLFGASGASGAAPGSWTRTGSLHTGRVLPLAVTLHSGKVLVTGGFDSNNQGLRSAELFDPKTGRWTATGSMVYDTSNGTITLLESGKVLVVGGISLGGQGVAAQLYNPATGRWRLTGKLTSPRINHTATLLRNGKVLVAGGQNQGQNGGITTAELYDPATQAWTPTGSMAMPRQNHTAALLHDGRVLVAGGNRDFFFGEDGSAEIYNPAGGSWATVGRMTSSRVFHTETVLADGSVIVAGGGYGAGAGPNPLDTTDRFDVARGLWLPSGDMQVAPGKRPAVGGRYAYSATTLPDGRVLAAGGIGFTNDFNSITVFRTAEIFDPQSGTWSLTGSLNVARVDHAAVVLADGRTMVVGGSTVSSPTATAEIFTPSVLAARANVSVGDIVRRENDPVFRRSIRPHPLRALSLAVNLIRAEPSRSAPAPRWRTPFALLVSARTGKWTLTGSMHVARSGVPMTLLRNGKVLIEGGDAFGTGGVTAELFDPATGTWSFTGSMHFPRFFQSAFLLKDGRVLVVGGTTGNDWWASAEIFDPATGKFTLARTMHSTRTNTAILQLADGRLLVPGGYAYGSIPRDSADLYDQTRGTWTATPSMNVPRTEFVSSVLPNGKVLVADGIMLNNTFVPSAELYDPASNTWSFTGSTNDITTNGVLLQNGLFLATDEAAQDTSDLYDFRTGKWTLAKGRQQAGVRSGDTLTLLTNGRPLLAGGCVAAVCPTAGTEIFDPVTQMWTLDARLNAARWVHAAVRLSDGRVLVAGGLTFGFVQIASAEIYTPAHLSSLWRSR